MAWSPEKEIRDLSPQIGHSEDGVDCKDRHERKENSWETAV